MTEPLPTLGDKIRARRELHRKTAETVADVVKTETVDWAKGYTDDACTCLDAAVRAYIDDQIAATTTYIDDTIATLCTDNGLTPP